MSRGQKKLAPCQNCIKIFNNMHHISGNTSSTKDEDLKALCVVCHSQQPNHAHMKPTQEQVNKIRKLRNNSPY